MLKLRYDNIQLPINVSELVDYDFFIFDNVTGPIVSAVNDPVKLSAFTSILVREGSCKAEINFISHEVTAPCLVNIPSKFFMHPMDVSDDFRASFVVLSSHVIDFMLSNIHDPYLFSLFKRNPILPLSEHQLADMTKLYDELMSIYADKSNRYMLQSLIHTMLGFLYKTGINCYEQKEQSTESTATGSRIVDQFLLLMQKHFREERFLNFYADKLGISPKHLSRTIKAETGLSPVEWINRYIILDAKVMLSSSNLNVQQIAEELHFPSQSFFGKYFKKATGMSPKEFRNKS